MKETTLGAGIGLIVGLSFVIVVLCVKLINARHELNHLKIQYQRTVEECADSRVSQEIKPEDLPKIREKWGVK